MLSAPRHDRAIYTVITGNYDELMRPSFVNDGWDYICFTDNPGLQSDFWDIRPIEDTALDGKRKSRLYKIKPHLCLQDYKYSLYIDANFDIIGDVDAYVRDYCRRGKLLFMEHPERDCIYEEARVCIESGKDFRQVIEAQVRAYRQEGYPAHNGLIAGGVIFREHMDAQVRALMDDWWEEVKTRSRRDQLSFNYVAWKHRYLYDESPLYYFSNRYFVSYPHSQGSIYSAQLYWATEEEGFSEGASIVEKVPDSSFSEEISVQFPLAALGAGQHTYQFRFDPDMGPLRLRLCEAALVDGAGGRLPLRVQHTNHTGEGEGALTFEHSDPQLYFEPVQADAARFTGLLFRLHAQKLPPPAAPSPAAAQYQAAALPLLCKFKRERPLFACIQIETVNACNNDCPFCPANCRSETRTRAVMEEALFGKILGELREMEYTGLVALFSNNEPFLDKRIIGLAQKAREALPNNFHYLLTNGTLLTPEKAEEICRWLDLLVIDNYSDDYEFLPPVKQIYDYCQSHPSLAKKIRIQKRRKHQILTSRGGQAPNKRRVKAEKGVTCLLPFEQLVVRPTGEVSLCCNDALGKYTLGDLKREGIRQVWFGPAFSQVREKLEQGREGLPLCEGCDSLLTANNRGGKHLTYFWEHLSVLP